MLKKITCSILFFAIFGSCCGQVASSGNGNQLDTSTKAEKKSHKPTGPSGLGPLKIGMSKSQVEALSAADGIYLTSSMTPYVSQSYVPVEGVDIFRTYMQTPLASTAFDTYLTFEAGKLSVINFGLDDAGTVLEKINSQISEKYGAGVVKSDKKEELCIYKNGANFKITTGETKTTWTEQSSKNQRIETITSDSIYNRCHDYLGHNGNGTRRIITFTIKKYSKPTSEKQKALF